MKKRIVKVEAADTGCGKIPHMTVDQLVERLHIESRELRCPACGRIHLTEEEVKEADEMLFSQTKRFEQIKAEAEDDKGAQ